MSQKRGLSEFIQWIERNADEIFGHRQPSPRAPAPIVLTDEEIAALARKAAELNLSHVADAVELAALTGFRKPDLLTVTWGDVGKFSIVKRATKTSANRLLTIPRLPALHSLLEKLKQRQRQHGVETVLVDGRGGTWSAAAFGSRFFQLCNAANLVCAGTPRVRMKIVYHDLRATFCARLTDQCNLDDEAAGAVMYWPPHWVAQIRKIHRDQSELRATAGTPVLSSGADQ